MKDRYPDFIKVESWPTPIGEVTRRADSLHIPYTLILTRTVIPAMPRQHLLFNPVDIAAYLLTQDKDADAFIPF